MCSSSCECILVFVGEMSVESSLSVSLKMGTFNKTKVAVNNTKMSSSTDSLVAMKKRSKRTKVLEGVGITIVVLIIIILTLLPVVFFYLPRDSAPMAPGNMTGGSNMCRDAVPYAGSVCRDHLLSVTQCFSSSDTFMLDSDAVLVMRGSSASVRQAEQLLSALQLFGTEQCVEAASPFLCVFLFGGVCGETDGTLYLPTASQCTEISTGVCQMEFEIARSIGMEIVDCSTLPSDTTLQCFNSTMEENSGQPDNDDEENENISLDMEDLLVPQNCTLSCRENFFCDEGTQRCFPKCPEWNLFPDTVSLSRDNGILTFAPIGLLAAVGVLVVSCLRREKVYVFPSILVVYQTVSILLLILLILITFFDRSYLYCTSRNLLESILNATSFCVISGIVFHYMVLQIILWWFLHVSALFWKVHFPVCARMTKSNNHLRVVHVACVVVGLLFPATPVVATIVDDIIQKKNSEQPVPGTLGFGLGAFPPILCTGLNETVTFYSLILPNVVMIVFGTVAMVLTIWRIHRTQGLFRSNRLLTRKNSFYVSTAEKKLLVVFCYYIVLQVVGFVAFSLSEQASDSLQTELFSYFLCEQSGHDPNNPCSRSRIEDLVYPGISILSIFMSMFAPFVNFVFVVDYSQLKRKLANLMHKSN